MAKCTGCPFAARSGTCLGISGRCGGEPAPRGPSARPPRAPGSAVVAGLVGLNLGLGGAESVDYLLARSTDPKRVRWAGAVAIEPSSASHPAALSRLSALMPVAHGLDAVGGLAGRVDVLVSWAPIDYGRVFRPLPWRPRLVQLAHFPGDSPFGEAAAAAIGPVDVWVGVSELAFDSMPPSIKGRARLVWNAVDPDRLRVTRDRATMRRLWGVPEGAKVAGYLGRFSPEKDPHAMARLAGSLPEGWVVVAVGAGHDRPGPADRLILPGADPLAGDVLNAFDALVVPSLYESFGLTMAEGIWMGLPLVATSSGLARMVPDVALLIPARADGPTIADAVLRADREGPRPAAKALIPRLDPARFGREWTDVICSVAPPSPPPPVVRPGVDPAVRDAVNACPSRGPVLPISMQADCGCRGKEVSECRAGKGKVAGRVTLADCLACKAG